MSFIIENNHIQVSNSSGQVIFDTNTPMPHIVQILENNVNHSFADSGDQTIITNQLQVPNSGTCSGWVYSCNWNYCTWYYDWNPIYYRSFSNKVLAKNQSTTYTLGSTNSAINPDFIIVSASATRTKAGSQEDYGSFVSAIPSNGSSIIANGSTVLESAFDASGDPWLSRIMSVYISGNDIKVEFKHSNRDYHESQRRERSSCGGYPNTVNSYDDTNSNWTVNFKIYIGKFTT